MATITNTFTSSVAKGNREDLANTIDNITPTATPLLSLAGKRTASNTSFDWQVDTNSAPDDTQALSEGFAFTAQSTAPTSRLSNTCQIVSKNATVSKTQEKMNSAGRSSEMGYQMAKRAAELKVNIDKIIGGKSPRSNGDPRKSRGLEHFLASSTGSSHGVGYVAPTDEFTALTDETASRSFTEALLVDSLQGLYSAGGDPNTIVLAPWSKRKFSAFVGRANSRVQLDSNEVNSTVDFYLSDFGTIKAILSRNIRPSTALIVDPAKLKTAWLRPYETKEEPVPGDVMVRSITCEFGLEVTNPAAHCVITGLATSASNEPT